MNQAQPSNFDELPESALIRLASIVPSNQNPHPLVAVSKSTWWRLVRARKAPQPVKLSAGVTAWRVGDLREWLAQAQRG